MRLPRAAAELDSEVTVAASGYSPPTPIPRQNLLTASESVMKNNNNIVHQRGQRTATISSEKSSHR
jgi:hypothetical protein